MYIRVTDLVSEHSLWLLGRAEPRSGRVGGAREQDSVSMGQDGEPWGCNRKQDFQERWWGSNVDLRAQFCTWCLGS